MEQEAQPQQIGSSHPNSKNKTSKPLIVAMSAAILIVGFGIYFFLYKTDVKNQVNDTESANGDVSAWKTYSNSKYGFEFKYPSNYYLTGQGELFSENDSDLEKQNDGISADAQRIRIGYSLATSQSAEGARKLAITTTDSGYRKANEASEKIVEINGIKAVVYFSHLDYLTSGKYNLHASFYDGQLNSIYFGLDGDWETLKEAEASNLNDVLIQILSTFKFTKIAQEAPNIESDLFKKYGFEMDFPGPWKNYRITEGVYGARSSLCFSFEHYCVMQISIYTPEQFNQFAAEYPLEAQNYDYKNDRYHYLFGYVPDCGLLSEFECQRTNEVPQILKTFRLQ